MSEREEWGPWIEHDGGGPPGTVGTPVMIRWTTGEVEKTFIGADIGYGNNRLGSWFWMPGSEPIIAYRMLRGIEDQIKMLRSLSVSPADGRVLEEVE